MNATGSGEHIDVSLFGVAVSWLSYWIAHYLATDETPTRAGSGFDSIASNDIYYATGDEPFYLCAVDDHLYERLCRTIDREDLLDDERFVDNDVRWDHRTALRVELETTSRTYDRDDLVDLLAESGVPAGPLKTIPEVITDGHIRDRDLLRTAHNVRQETDVTITRLPARTANWVPETGDRPPMVGEDTRKILRSAGYDEGHIGELVLTERSSVTNPTRPTVSR